MKELMEENEMMEKQSFKVGDRVKWMSGGGEAEGLVVRVAEESGRIGDFVYGASGDDPRYIVETEEGKRAAQRAEALVRA